MPLKPHPTDPEKMVYFSHRYDIPQLQGVTTAPQREWVGLTDEDIESWVLPDKPTVAQFARFVETKLKEKNNAT